MGQEPEYRRIHDQPIIPSEINSPTYGYSPAQIQNAYGLSPSLGDGTGQTIAIIAVGDDPTIANDLCVFDTIINIPNGPSFSFEKVNASGQAYNYPKPRTPVRPRSTWSGRTRPRREPKSCWSRPIRQGHRRLVQSGASGPQPELRMGGGGASVVSISYGGRKTFCPKRQINEQQADASTFQAAGVTFVAASGDSGAYGDYKASGGKDTNLTVSYPASSPDVVAVGGTTLYDLDAAGDYNSAVETGWNLGSDVSLGLPYDSASGGGISGTNSGQTKETEPAWQSSVVPSVLEPNNASGRRARRGLGRGSRDGVPGVQHGLGRKRRCRLAGVRRHKHCRAAVGRPVRDRRRGASE